MKKRRSNKDKNDDIFDIDKFDVEIDPDDPVYPLNVVCRLLDMSYWTVHDVLEEGIIHYAQNNKKKLLSYHDVKRLKYIKYLIENKGVNIKGIKVIFEIKGDI